MLILWLFAISMVAHVGAIGEYGLCLYNLTHTAHSYAVCEPPNQLPQDCVARCDAGYYPTGSYQLTCMISICTNRCMAIDKTCRGSVPSQQIDAQGNVYTEYIQEERPCCELKTVESDWCNLGACTGNCENPGVYTFEPYTCPDTCIPFQEVTSDTLTCSPCILPTLSQGIYLSVDGTPAGKATVGCPAGSWGSESQEIICTNTGSWFPTPNVTCSTCPPHPYDLGTLDRDVFDVEETAGSVRVTCKAPVFVPTTWTFSCHPNTGEWSYWDEMVCYEAITATPTPSTTPSPEPTTSITPSPSKSPRPPKVKGSRAPSPRPKIRGVFARQ
jgi:hypothetical protein